jgi:hypothetical protein
MDEDERVTAEWLNEHKGWETVIHWPSRWTPSQQLLEWRGAGLWIGQTPIVLVKNRGHMRQICEALNVRMELRR